MYVKYYIIEIESKRSLIPTLQLPYYIDGNVKLTQSLAIIRHLARKHNLVGNNEEEQNRVSLVEQQLKDNHMAFTRICYDPNFETLKVDFLKQLPQTLELLSKFLGERPYFAGLTILIGLLDPI